MHALTHDQREACCQVPRVAPQSLGDGRQGKIRRLVVPVEMPEGAVHEREVPTQHRSRIGVGDRRVGAPANWRTLRLNLSKLRHALSQSSHLFRKHRNEGIPADPGNDELQDTRCRRESPIGCLRASYQLGNTYEMVVKPNGNARAAQTDRADMAADAWGATTGADVNQPVSSAGRRAPGSELSGATRMDQRRQRRRLSGPWESSRKTRHGGQARDLSKEPARPAHAARELDEAQFKAGAWLS